MKILLSFLIFLIVCLPAIVLSFIIVPLLLLTAWSGKTTIFGNVKHGKGDDQGYTTFLGHFNWLVLRNPVNNLLDVDLAFSGRPYLLTGSPNIGDKIAGGSYVIKMGSFWEYYWVKPYTVFGSKRCVRVRIGWKIKDNTGLCPYVFTFNPVKVYLGG